MTRRKKSEKATPGDKPLSAHQAGQIAAHGKKAASAPRKKVRYDAENSEPPAPRVTESESEVLAGVADSLSNTAIARRRGVKISTVEKHLENAYVKLGVHSRADAAIWFLKRKLREKDQIIAELQKLLAEARRRQP